MKFAGGDYLVHPEGKPGKTFEKTIFPGEVRLLIGYEQHSNQGVFSGESKWADLRGWESTGKNARLGSPDFPPEELRHV